VTGKRKQKKKKARKGFGLVEQVRLRAREALGPPPPARAVPSRKDKPPKHKKELIERELEGS